MNTIPLEPKQITLEFLRSELIGKDTMIPTPFGSRRLTYADYVASGRALGFLEKHLHDQVLTTYANTHTEDSFTGARSTHFAHEAAEYVKTCLNANGQFKIVFAGSGSTGAIKRLQEILGLAISSPLRKRMLEIMQPEERPVVFVGPYEHHSSPPSRLWAAAAAWSCRLWPK